jgi:hypothetical protein
MLVYIVGLVLWALLVAFAVRLCVAVSRYDDPRDGADHAAPSMRATPSLHPRPRTLVLDVSAGEPEEGGRRATGD